MKLRTIAIAAAVTLGAAGCQSEALDDAPVGTIDDSPVFVITNADTFPNMAMACYEGALIITTTRDYGDAVNVVPEFKGCADGDPIPKEAGK